ncbi:MAG: vanadium-dependent haloperoxidase, partial [Actinobacteria bacterium]|nr:vanadium-dependent haloperoxidase [Actinomycetota bacterium]
AAAHATLSKLFPSQKPFFDFKHAQAGLLGPGLNEGHEFGVRVAQEMLDERKDDPGAGDDGYAASVARGAHRPDPSVPDQGFHAPFYGARSKLFAATMRHQLNQPPQPSVPPDPEYTAALKEVRRKGIAPELMGTLPTSSSRRTVDETLIGVYWAYDGAVDLGTPPRLYNQIVRNLAEKGPITGTPNTLEDNARLFALVNTAMADAGILSWDQKYIHDLWRPVVGIREHDTSMGPAAGEGDNNTNDESQPDWLPLGAPSSNSTGKKNATPSFPAYPSGHATFGAAAFHVTRLFYGVAVGDKKKDNLFDDLVFVSDEHNGVTKDNKGTVRPRHVRDFPDGLWQMIVENGRSRVDLGVHWVFDAFAVKNGKPDLGQNVGGVPLGLTIAEDIFTNPTSPGTVNKSSVGPTF